MLRIYDTLILVVFRYHEDGAEYTLDEHRYQQLTVSILQLRVDEQGKWHGKITKLSSLQIPIP